MFKLDFKKFKKISSDKHHTVLQHPAGHEIKLHHKALAPQLKKELNQLHMAKGGEMRQSNPKLEESKKVPHFFKGWDGEMDDDLDVSPVSQDAVEYEEAGTPPSAEEIGAMQQTASPDMGAEVMGPPSPDKVMGPPTPSAPVMGPPSPDKVMGPPTPPEYAAQAEEQKPAAQPTTGVVEPKDQYEVLAKSNDDTASVLGKLEKNISSLQETYKKADEAENKAYDDWMKDIKEQKIQPNRYYAEMGTEQKILTALALGLGGLGVGLAGGTNPALEYVNKAIDRDIDAQKQNIDIRNNLYKANLMKYKNQKDAILATRGNMLAAAQVAVQKLNANAKSDMAKAQGAQIQAGLQQQLTQIKQQLSLKQTVKNYVGSNNPIIPYKATAALSIMNPTLNKDYRLRSQTLEEIKEAQNANQFGLEVVELFDQAVEDQRSGRGINPRTRARLEALEEKLAQTTQGLVGTVRSEAMKVTKGAYVPKSIALLLSTEENEENRRNELIKYLSSRRASPAFEQATLGFAPDGVGGLTLNNFLDTATPEALQKSGLLKRYKSAVKRVTPEGKVIEFDPITKQPIRQ